MNVFFEGPSFVGKTSLLNALREKKNNIAVIEEHDVYSHGINNYPPFPSRTLSQAIENVDFFYDLERRRHADAQKNTNNTHKILFDRSIFSVILFQKYIRSLQLDDHASAYEYAKTKALSLIEGGLISLPDTIIYVTADYETVQSRYDREVSVDLLRGYEAHSFFTSQYEIILQAYQSYGLAQQIKTSNTRQSTEIGIDKAYRQLQAWEDSRATIDVCALAVQTVKAL